MADDRRMLMTGVLGTHLGTQSKDGKINFQYLQPLHTASPHSV
jgi:hypothetical protein